MHQLLLARGTCSILLPWQIISIQNCKLNHVTIKKKKTENHLSIKHHDSACSVTCTMSQRPSVCWGRGANFTWAILGGKIFHIKWSCFQFSDIQNLQTVSKKVMTMSSCLEKGEGSSVNYEVHCYKVKHYF